MAALLSSGGLFGANLWQTATSELFVGFLGLLKEHVAGPLTAVLDNASIHTAKRIQPFVDLLKKQGQLWVSLQTQTSEMEDLLGRD